MPAATMFCCRCKTDVSATKRVKDSRGNFYCEPCYQAAVKQQQLRQQQQQQPQQQQLKRPTPPPPPAPGQNARTAAPAASASAPKPLPSRCPACDAIMLPGRRICIKCNRDVTKLDKLLAVRARNAQVSSEEKVGEWIGKTIKAAFILFIIGACAFMGYGAWLMFHPGEPFDDYPKTRADAVHLILADISEGSDKSYEAAFKLISLRVRTTANERQDLLYKMVFKRMHDDFIQKYGADWLAKAKIENEDPGSNDEIVPFTVTINDDAYHVLSQAQVAGGVSTFENTLLHGRQEYLENGKRHFGVFEIYEYTVRQKGKHEPQGPTKLKELKPLDDLQPLDKNAPTDNNKPDPNGPPAP